MNKKISGSKKSISREEICQFLEENLRISSINDTSVNGLQVEGPSEISKIGFTVDACLESFNKAKENNCQMIIVHHGLIWNGLTRITGVLYRRIRFLIENNINLFAVHLPLDLHPQFGNNAVISSILSVKNLKPFGLYRGINIGFEGEIKETSVDEIVKKLNKELNTECSFISYGKVKIKKVAIISGKAPELLDEAIEKKIDCFITGEPSYQNYHLAIESGINIIYAGHYYSEKTGIRALKDFVSQKLNIETFFIDTPPLKNCGW
ncbi:MAG: Nif3-like dinuclear metal center hexameric protein [Chitinispirillaceae bacterium]|nr:Nif3-like dinuclear metal center hexameric protein [Chitinispirillaceae bacterium]